MSICSVDTCPRRIVARGLCDRHYREAKRSGDPLPPTRQPKPCAFPGCPKRIKADGVCDTHHYRLRVNGSIFVVRRVKTGRRLTKQGYVAIWKPGHPLAMKMGYVLEHRMVAWDAGLFTDPTYEVHHLNGDKTDNRLENLQPETASEHQRRHHSADGMTVSNGFGTWTVGEGKGRVWKEAKAAQGERFCEWCGGPIPWEKRTDARHCSQPCQFAAWKVRNPR